MAFKFHEVVCPNCGEKTGEIDVYSHDAFRELEFARKHMDAHILEDKSSKKPPALKKLTAPLYVLDKYRKKVEKQKAHALYAEYVKGEQSRSGDGEPDDEVVEAAIWDVETCQLYKLVFKERD